MTLKMGATGPAVGKLHQQLMEASYSIEANELRGSNFGASTKLAVEDFQARHVGPKGEQLQPDGVIGPRTLWALENPQGPGDAFKADGWRCDPLEAHASVRGAIIDALGDIGKREQPSGSNNGPEIAKFLPGGLPWCAFAASTWLMHAEGGNPMGRKGSCFKIREWALGHNAIVKPEDAEPGDLWLAIRAGGHGHVELIVARLEADRVACVGGNVGQAVRGTLRTPSSATAIVRVVPR